MNSRSAGALRKFGLFLAVVVCATLAVGCVFGAWFFVSENFYTTPKDKKLAEFDRTLMWRDSVQIAERTVHPDSDYYRDTPTDMLYDRSVTNLRYLFTDEEGNVLSANVPYKIENGTPIPLYDGEGGTAYETGSAETAPIYGEGHADVSEGWTSLTWYFTTFRNPETGEEIHNIGRSRTPAPYSEVWDGGENVRYLPVSTVPYTFLGRLADNLPVEDNYRFMHRVFNLIYDVRYAVYPVGAVSLILCVLCFVLLMCASARRPGGEGVYPGPFHRVPFDLLAALGFGSWALTAHLMSELSYSSYNKFIFAVAIGVGGVLAVSILLGLCMSAAGRIKSGTMVQNNVTVQAVLLVWKLLCFLGQGARRVFSFLAALVRGIPLVWKTLLLAAGLIFFDFFVLAASHPDLEVYVIYRVIRAMILVPAVLWIALSMRRLEKTGQSLAAGTLSHQVDTKGMFPVLKRHGENLNAIGEGINRAVEERMKSERMKTELITNVSHDLKTPLTSIVNYAGLIAGEDTDNPRIREYSEVLLRQSERMKRLIEDLVEASKAQTGNLDVELSPTDACVFLEQAAGEYESRISGAGMTLCSAHPDHPVTILADGRRLWRVFDNLMNNIVKYGQPGTRVYLTLEDIHDFAVVTFRNVSREPLNLPPEELMERFVRGDASRNSATEGNGLGLSIAKSLTELQGGALSLSIDGDLFKAVLHFPKYSAPASQPTLSPAIVFPSAPVPADPARRDAEK